MVRVILGAGEAPSVLRLVSPTLVGEREGSEAGKVWLMPPLCVGVTDLCAGCGVGSASSIYRYKHYTFNT